MTNQDLQMEPFEEEIESQFFEHEQEDIVSFGVNPPDQLLGTEEHPCNQEEIHLSNQL